MAEKGGKGFSIGNNNKGKAPMKTPARMLQRAKKKGNSSVTFDNVAHVQIDSDSDSEGFVEVRNQGSPLVGDLGLSNMKSGGKTSTELPNGNLTTAGKDAGSGKAGEKAKVANVPKATAVKPSLAEVELKLELEIPPNSRLLMDCEAASILQGVQEHLISLSDDPKIKTPESFNKALQYCKYGDMYTDVQSVRKLLDDNLKKYGVTDSEICMIGNVCPESVEEVYALIPSLKAHRIKNEWAIKLALKGLDKLKKAM